MTVPRFLHYHPGGTLRCIAPLLGLSASLWAAKADAAIMSSDDFETGSSSGWSPQMSALTSEWAIDSTTDVSNCAYRRVDQSGTTGAWNDAIGGGTFGDMTVTANVRINAWNGTGSDQAAVFARWSSSAGQVSWYSVAITSDGWMHIRRNAAGTVTNLVDVNNIMVQPGEWFNVRLEVTSSNPVHLTAYLGDVWEGHYDDYSQSNISNGYYGIGTFGADASFDDVVIGDANEVLAGMESGEQSWLAPLKSDNRVAAVRGDAWWMRRVRGGRVRHERSGARLPAPAARGV
jgi:hypothetical protein